MLGLLYVSIVVCAGKHDLIPESFRTVTYTQEEAQQKYPDVYKSALQEAPSDPASAENFATQKVMTEHNNQAKINWVLMLLIYSGVASVLPVWLLLQPRDFINSHQLVVGLGTMFLAVLIFNPTVVAPEVRWSVKMDCHGHD